MRERIKLFTLCWVILEMLFGREMLFAQPRNRIGFVLEPDRPFVDIVFDRTAPWNPVFEGESSQGIWLKLRNNCAYPISVGVLTMPNKNPGVLLVHEIQKVIGSVPLPPDQARSVQTIHNNYLGADIRNAVELQPGRALEFGVPMEHITRFVSVRVEFEIRLPKRASGRQPRTYLDYYWIDLPREVQILSDKVTSAPKAK